MIAKLTESQQKNIVNNLVAACKNIDKLNRTGYSFIYLASGFIAHYDITGFKSFYTDYSLRDDIIRNASMNMWSNFREGDMNYAYYMSKRDVYTQVVNKLNESR